ncbi:MAG: YwiC-like family protein [Actinomycetota bacterium]|nr:YwiC-like family protein [Actinomycetota bacterium]MDK1017672.1 YwiC-like family protein [Actinomycetota bacterium]MDK1026083.1 YwiC-like family protein [Actinomycetota bacterium]MDK1038439.1 YwiC-like family protein [Actinomycetota bacterium]MDK1096751.1 YwiC-like family protein [Actinomycetota bacterium]
MEQRATPVRIRSIALPTEHGGWGFTLEPILLGLLVAPSSAAWGISAAALGIFLARRPVKIVSTDLVRRRWLQRSRVGLIFALVYSAIAVAGAIWAFSTADGPFWIPVIVAAPFALLALRADAHSKNRALAAELSGSIAMGATVAAIAVAGGWELAPAFGLWLILAARDVAAIVLVRGQVRRLHDKPFSLNSIYTVQATATGTVAIAAAVGIVPWLGVAAVGLVGLVAVVSLNTRPVAAKVIGWTQMGVGLAVVLITSLGANLTITGF